MARLTLMDTTKHWPSREAADRYYEAEGFITGTITCLACGKATACAVEPEGVTLEACCPRCHSFNATFKPNKT